MLGQVIITTVLINNMRDIGTGPQRGHISVSTIRISEGEYVYGHEFYLSVHPCTVTYQNMPWS